ncbi:MAG TPA: lamin tail domain-containing protein, partial [Ohtaekwangia sp.]
MKQTLQILSFSFLKTFTEKIFLTLILLAIAQQVLAQFNDNFDDGSLSSDPVWSFDETRFTVSAGQLRLMAPPVADVSYLTTECAAINGASWEFYVRLTFNPSSSNYCRIYLTSDQADLTGTVNGYYVMIGNTADEISLYNQSGTSRVKIIDGTDGRLNNTASEMKIKVLRDDEGNWQLFSDVGLTGHFILEGAARDEEHFSSSYFGILCTYTATRSDRFYFDDIIVSGNPYIPPPPAEYKDVIITEIFPDPAPRVELPESEFLEIYNRSENNFNISEWQLADGTSVASLPNFSLSTGKYLILTSTSSVADFVSYGDVIGVPGFPSLNNAADAVTLRSTTGLLIDSVRYESSWYKSDIKREGGWSLELIDPANKCGEENNWTESEDTAGGTPGKINSVLADKPDVTGPLLLSAIPSSATELLVYFNEKLSNTLPDSQHFTVAPTNHVLTTAFLDQGMRVLRLQLAEPLQPRILYSLSSTAVYDCAANLLQAGTSTVSFALPETSDTLDVVINEILFNPKPTGVDFVEIVNASEKYLNLESWALVNSESKEHTHKITDDNILFGPGEYRVLTTDKNVLIGEYLNTAEDRVIEVASLP